MANFILCIFYSPKCKKTNKSKRTIIRLVSKVSHKLLNEKHTHTHTKAQEGSCEFGFIWGVTEGHGLGDILSHSSVELLLELSRAEPYSPKYKVPSMSPEEKLKSPRAP